MRQAAQTVSPTQLPQADLRSPVLQSALANLDVQLEEELARYRRQRLQNQRSPRSVSRSQSASGPQLMSISAAAAPAIAASPSHDLEQDVWATATQPFATQPAAAIDERLAPSPTDMNAGIHPDIDSSGIDSNVADLAIAPVSETGTKTSMENGSLWAIPGEELRSDEGLEDYLESSEELLRSLAEEEAKVQAERGLVRGLLTPLGVGSMLLLLVSSAMFGYLIMNPTGLSRMFAQRQGLPTSPANSSTEAAPTATSPTDRSPLNVPQPNLAAQEFKDLGLDTLGSLRSSAGGKPSTQTVPSATPATPIAPANSSTTGTTTPGTPTLAPSGSSVPTRAEPAAPAPEPPPVYSPPLRSNMVPSAPLPPSRSVAPEPPAPRSAPLPPSTPPNDSSSSSSTPESFPNKIVVNYGGDQSLEAAKRVVPDAYVRNFPDGAKIQLGAYSNAADAEARAEELRKQGISAEVHKR